MTMKRPAVCIQVVSGGVEGKATTTATAAWTKYKRAGRGDRRCQEKGSDDNQLEEAALSRHRSSVDELVDMVLE